MLIRSVHQSGFTLFELLIGMALVGILFALAIPQYNVWVQNSQIKTIAESLLAGMQFAKSEAIKRNQNVEIVFDPDFRAWNVNLAQAGTLLRRQAGLANFPNVQITPDVSSSDRLTFSGLGRVLRTNQNNSAPFNQLSIDNTVLDQLESQDLVITVSQAGSLKMCNPNKLAPDPRAC